MATEKGIVFKVGEGLAWVRTSRTSACEGCADRKSCHISADGKEMEVEAINAIGARVDDKVVLHMKSSALLKASFLLYVFPILVMLAAALIGQHMAPAWDLNPSGFSAVCGIGGFVLAFQYIRRKSNRLGRDHEFRPKIIRIIH
jgi:sigma-E factor negative regulatory protein RseC